MKRSKLFPVILAGVMSITGVCPAFADGQEQIQAVQDRVDDLETKKQELEAYLSELNSRYEELTGNVEELSLQAGKKAEELKEVQAQLEQIKEDERKQYESMKLRVSYMYEKGGSSWLELLLSSKDLAEFLNKAEYISQITQYDRNMLKKYEETREQVAQKEEQIQTEIQEINTIRTEGSAKQQELREMVASTNDSISQYAQQIASNEEEARLLMEQIKNTETNGNELMTAIDQTGTEEQTAAAEQTDAGETDSASLEQQDNTGVYPPGYDPAVDTLGDSSSSFSTNVTVDVTYETEETAESQEYAAQEEEPVYEEPVQEDWTAAETETEETSGASGGQGTYLGNFTLTAYCGCAQCCGAAGQPTASGVMPVSGHTVAMAGVPFGTQLLINGVVYTVEDLGTPYGHVDIYFDSHDAALAFGLQYADVYQLN